MKKNLLFLLFIVFFSCQKKENQPLNKLSPEEFEKYIQSIAKKDRGVVVSFLDSISNLPNLKNLYKGKISRSIAEIYLRKNQLDSASIKNREAFLLGNDEVNSDLVSNYYQLARISLKQGYSYKALYYNDKAAEILLKTEIYKVPPSYTADVLLTIIAYQNKYLNQINLASKYLDGALKKAKKHKADSVALSDIYQIKGALFTDRNNLNKDSVFYYFNKGKEAGGTKVKKRLEINFNYAKAELYYYTNELDSCLHYVKGLPKTALDESLNDELNLLALYSKKGMLKKADEMYYRIKNPPNGQFLTQADSLSYLENLVNYYQKKGEYVKMGEKLRNFMSFHHKYYLKESDKKLEELSTIIDLQQKDLKIKKIEQKISTIEGLLQRRDLLIALISIALLTILLISMYIRNQAAQKQLLLENEQVKLKNKTTDLEMNLLRSQIKPHFIFNTLASIQSKIRLGEQKDSIRYLNSFSKLMREILELGRNSDTTLQQELSVIHKYVELQQLRNNNFTFTTDISEDVEEELDDIYLPALTLQPFVENAILHGFKAIDYKGEILLTLKIKNDNLHITIVDNGCGLKDTIHKKGHNSHAINIIRDRLVLLEEASKVKTLLSVKNREGYSGVIVTLEVPMS